MTDAALDFMAYRDLKEAAEGAEELLLAVRAAVFGALDPEADQREAFADLVALLEDAPQLEALRKALGHAGTLPPAIDLG